MSRLALNFLCRWRSLTLNFWFCCLCLSSAGVTSLSHHIQLVCYWGPGLCACRASTPWNCISSLLDQLQQQVPNNQASSLLCLLTYSQWIFHTLLKAEEGDLGSWAVLDLFVHPKWLFQVIGFTVAEFCYSSELPKDVWQGEPAWEFNGSQDDCPERVLVGPRSRRPAQQTFSCMLLKVISSGAWVGGGNYVCCLVWRGLPQCLFSLPSQFVPCKPFSKLHSITS